MKSGWGGILLFEDNVIQIVFQTQKEIDSRQKKNYCNKLYFCM